MTPEIALHRKLGQASRRIRILLAWRYGARMMLAAGLASLAVVVAAKLRWLNEPTPESLALIVGGAALIGALLGALRRITPMDAALLTDLRMQTKERLASAVEFEEAPADDPILRRQIQDAGEHARTLDLRQVYPVRLDREAGLALLVTAALFSAYFIPAMPIFWSRERREEMAQVKKHGLAIERVARDAEQSAAEKKLGESARAAREAQKLATAMKKGGMDKKTALVKLNKLTKQMAEQHRRLAAASSGGAKSLEKAAEEIRRALEQKLVAAEQAASLNKSAANAGQKETGEQKQSEAMQKAQEALKKFADALSRQDPQAQNQALQELAGQMESGRMSKQEMQQLQQQMEKIANALKNTELNRAGEQLAKLAEQMKNLSLDPEALKQLAQMAKQAGGT